MRTAIVPVALCDNRGTWPVLIGEEGDRDAMLSSPIILYDYPAIAPESPGDLFDGTEIDEILTLRILAMTDAEKHEAAATDARVRALLLRTESLAPAALSRLHGTMRAPQSSMKDGELRGPPASLHLTVGAHVRLRPNAGGDIMDLALKDKIAVVEAIEHDFEDRIHVAVTLLDDPGKDLGAYGFPGHRFYFSPEEIDLSARRTAHEVRFIAGIGNIFNGDDAFGVEVVRRLRQRPLPPEVKVIDSESAGSI